jgi:alpha-L-fucosidase
MKQTIRILLASTLGFALMYFVSACTETNPYEPTKESIIKHPTPDWFREARIGVFIHYNPYAYDLTLPEGFSAEEWIGLFDKAGAEYFVYTTKHNNGWCNWPSSISENSASEKNGPYDLVTPLVETARREGMKVGLYYNLMNRFKGVSPDMAKNPDLEPSAEYVLDYLHPEIKELVRTYNPDLLWTDGDWISTSEYWHSNEIVAWLYNWAEKEKRELCLTDRWGRDIRICTTKETPELYGDFWTLERRIMKEEVNTHPWESCLTLTEHWSYRENLEFHVPVDELIGIMCDIVSKGGKFLVNIGPAPDGSIVDSDREALLAIGSWLEVNGEAIYGSQPLDCSGESKTGKDRDRAKELLLPKTGINDFPNVWKQLLDFTGSQGPLRFTRNGSFIYAIHQGWPGETLEFDSPGVNPGTEISMLGIEEPLSWRVEGNRLVVELPDEKPCEHAFVLKMKSDE